MSLGAKITLTLWIIIGLGLLFAFTFSLFVIAILAGLVILILRLFGARTTPTMSVQNPEIFIDNSRSQQSEKKRSDDIIDI